MLRYFWLAWSILTWLSAMLCTAGCLLPFWLKGTVRLVGADWQSVTRNSDSHSRALLLNNVKDGEVYSDLGLYRRCVFPLYSGNGAVKLDNNCGHYHFSDVPHWWWKVALLCLVAACCALFFLTFFLFFVGFCLDLLQHKWVNWACQGLQTLAGLLGITACILYPLGWENNWEVAQICGNEARRFYIGRCYLGWAYVLTLAGSVMALLTTSLPVLMNLYLDNMSSLLPQCTSATTLPTGRLGMDGSAAILSGNWTPQGSQHRIPPPMSRSPYLHGPGSLTSGRNSVVSTALSTAAATDGLPPLLIHCNPNFGDTTSLRDANTRRILLPNQVAPSPAEFRHLLHQRNLQQQQQQTPGRSRTSSPSVTSLSTLHSPFSPPGASTHQLIGPDAQMYFIRQGPASTQLIHRRLSPLPISPTGPSSTTQLNRQLQTVNTRVILQEQLPHNTSSSSDNPGSHL